ncbi:unnamed protein product, partial [Ectocarpus fasciculatus]
QGHHTRTPPIGIALNAGVILPPARYNLPSFLSKQAKCTLFTHASGSLPSPTRSRSDVLAVPGYFTFIFVTQRRSFAHGNSSQLTILAAQLQQLEQLQQTAAVSSRSSQQTPVTCHNNFEDVVDTMPTLLA